MRNVEKLNTKAHTHTYTDTHTLTYTHTHTHTHRHTHTSPHTCGGQSWSLNDTSHPVSDTYKFFELGPYMSTLNSCQLKIHDCIKKVLSQFSQGAVYECHGLLIFCFIHFYFFQVNNGEERIFATNVYGEYLGKRRKN